MIKYPRIVFIGTTDFAVKSLKKLIELNYLISLVITIPDKFYKNKLIESAVKKIALLYRLPILQPKNLKDQTFLNELKSYKADLQIVVDFRMLPKKVWSLPILGTFNLHASLLPQYRGAAPIQWAIINGETETGLTTFFLDDKIDTGHILLQKKITIGIKETAGNLSNRMAYIGADLVIETVKGLVNKNIKSIPQPKCKNLKIAPKIYRKDCRIDWNLSIDFIFNKIRGFSPYPAAWTLLYLDEYPLQFKIYRSDIIKQIHNKYIKEIIITKSSINIAVKNGYILILEGQIEGRRKMCAIDIINGIKNKKKLYIE
ncbi:MAG: methionyl-tRNA formyltransferase [Candidatus Bostrichicola ureolyticus]|nr:MAG: methionyl-tRNA formyltransferase [Candidatus Bostrichicola ureolyticus]